MAENKKRRNRDRQRVDRARATPGYGEPIYDAYRGGVDSIFGEGSADYTAGLARSAVNGITAGWGEYPEAALAFLGPTDFYDELAQIRADQAEFGEDYPVSSGAAEVGGALGSIFIPATYGLRVAKGASLPVQAASNAAIYGGIAGAGYSDPDSVDDGLLASAGRRAIGAGQGAALAAPFGYLGGVAAPHIERGVSKAAQYIPRLTRRAPETTPARGARLAMSKMEADPVFGPDSLANHIRRAGRSDAATVLDHIGGSDREKAVQIARSAMARLPEENPTRRMTLDRLTNQDWSGPEDISRAIGLANGVDDISSVTADGILAGAGRTADGLDAGLMTAAKSAKTRAGRGRVVREVNFNDRGFPQPRVGRADNRIGIADRQYRAVSDQEIPVGFAPSGIRRMNPSFYDEAAREIAGDDPRMMQMLQGTEVVEGRMNSYFTPEILTRMSRYAVQQGTPRWLEWARKVQSVRDRVFPEYVRAAARVRRVGDDAALARRAATSGLRADHGSMITDPAARQVAGRVSGGRARADERELFERAAPIGVARNIRTMPASEGRTAQYLAERARARSLGPAVNDETAEAIVQGARRDQSRSALRDEMLAVPAAQRAGRARAVADNEALLTFLVNMPPREAAVELGMMAQNRLLNPGRLRSLYEMSRASDEFADVSEMLGNMIARGSGVAAGTNPAIDNREIHMQAQRKWPSREEVGGASSGPRRPGAEDGRRQNFLEIVSALRLQGYSDDEIRQAMRQRGYDYELPPGSR